MSFQLTLISMLLLILIAGVVGQPIQSQNGDLKPVQAAVVQDNLEAFNDDPALYDYLEQLEDAPQKRWANQVRFGKRASWASSVRFG